MKKAIMALIVSLILLFAAGKPALTLAGEYADFEDDSSDAFFEFDGTGTWPQDGKYERFLRILESGPPV